MKGYFNQPLTQGTTASQPRPIISSLYDFLLLTERIPRSSDRDYFEIILKTYDKRRVILTYLTHELIYLRLETEVDMAMRNTIKSFLYM